MQIEAQRLSLEQYRAYCDAHASEGREFELLDGVMMEKDMASYAPSKIAARIIYYLTAYIMENPIGEITGSDGTYIMDENNSFIPDAAYISHVRLPADVPREVPIPPDLAVEVKSSTDSKRALRRKAERYLELGTRMVWLVFPDEQQVEVYVASADVITLTSADTLDGGEVLPNFQLAISKLWV